MPIFFREFMSTIFVLMMGFFPFLVEKDDLFQNEKPSNKKVHIIFFEFEIQTHKEREKEAHVFVGWLIIMAW